MSDDTIESPATSSTASKAPRKSASSPGKARAKADAVMQTRISTRHRDLIDDAAALRGVSRSTFVVETLVAESEAILLESLLFRLDEPQSAALAEIFDNPTPPTEALRELMSRKAPWE